MQLVRYEDQIEAQALPGRALKWLFTPDMGLTTGLSVNIAVLDPGRSVKPAHSHPEREEVIYVSAGTGQVYIDGAVHDLRPGAAVLFPRGAVHMVRNTGDIALKLICFFAPGATLADYTFHEDIAFPDT